MCLRILRKANHTTELGRDLVPRIRGHEQTRPASNLSAMTRDTRLKPPDPAGGAPALLAPA